MSRPTATQSSSGLSDSGRPVLSSVAGPIAGDALVILLRLPERFLEAAPSASAGAFESVAHR